MVTIYIIIQPFIQKIEQHQNKTPIPKVEREIKYL